MPGWKVRDMIDRIDRDKQQQQLTNNHIAGQRKLSYGEFEHVRGCPREFIFSFWQNAKMDQKLGKFCKSSFSHIFSFPQKFLAKTKTFSTFGKFLTFFYPFLILEIL